MKYILIPAALTLFVFGGVSVALTGTLPCHTPLHYAVGSLDPRFNISDTDLRGEIATAENVWDQAAGKPLFVYDSLAPLKVNLIFDDRERQTLEGKQLDQSKNQTEKTRDALVGTQGKLKDAYDAATREYVSQLNAFKDRLTAYNAEVKQWNVSGGAPPDVYDRLKQEAKDLDTLQTSLEKKRLAVNALADQVNASSARQVQVVQKYNDQVENYVNRYGAAREFDQGVYDGKAIDIYQFEDRAHLRLVLAHELGHALGLGHVSNPAAVMYYLLRDQPLDTLTLAPEDRVALNALCAQTAWDKFRQTLGAALPAFDARTSKLLGPSL